jgi:hypothetical protein
MYNIQKGYKYRTDVDILENNSLAHNNFLPGHPGKIEACLA